MRSAIIFVVCSIPVLLYAHGGHGVFDPHSLLHYIASPEHGVPILLVLAVLLYVWRKKSLLAKDR